MCMCCLRVGVAMRVRVRVCRYVCVALVCVQLPSENNGKGLKAMSAENVTALHCPQMFEYPCACVCVCVSACGRVVKCVCVLVCGCVCQLELEFFGNRSKLFSNCFRNHNKIDL